MSNLVKFTLFSISLLLYILLIYLIHPTIAYDFLLINFLVVIIPVITYFFISSFIYNVFPKKLFYIFLAYLTIIFIFTASIINYKKYNKLLENNEPIEERVFNKDVSPIDISQIRLVDEEVAHRLGEKFLGQKIALGSIVKLGDFTLEIINKKLYWVSPLVYSSFFKWLNSDFTPGYIKVSATNSNDVSLVLNYKIKYQPEAFFHKNLQRHLWLNGYMTQGLTDYSFEVDDTGKPFWVVTKYVKRVGLSGKDAVGTVIVNPETGDIKEYSIKDTPKWVDRIQPEEFIKEQLSDYGLYKKGWLNSKLFRKGVILPTEDISIVFGKNGDAYYYTGMKSAGKEGSIVGFMLVNTRNKKTIFYKTFGATEEKARKSAEGMVQEKRYVGTKPILYNVLGVPTYILTLKDKEGLVKKVAMVSVEHYEIVGIGNNIKDSLRDYKSKLLSTKNTDISSSIKLKELEDVIDRINTDIKDGNTYYYLKTKSSKKIFILDSSLSEDIILTRDGDKIKVKYEDSNNKFINIDKFKNLSL